MTSQDNANFALNRLSAGLCYANKSYALNCYLDALESLKDAINQVSTELAETQE